MKTLESRKENICRLTIYGTTSTCRYVDHLVKEKKEEKKKKMKDILLYMTM